MKLVFVTNRLTWHQVPISDEFYKLLGDDYTFVAEKTIPIGKEDKYPNGNDYKYFKLLENNNMKEVQNLIDCADCVIIGSASDKLIKNRLKNRKITFRYSERFYKNGVNLKNFLKAFAGSLIHHYRYKNYPLYMLCASAYTAGDAAIFGNYNNKCYKWGYFPEDYTYDIDELIRNKNKNEIVWVARLIDWKHPELAVLVAKQLKNDGYSFKMNIIGEGDMKEYLENKIKEYNLENYVNLIGFVTPSEVNEYMCKAGIHIFTSDFGEGWGAVLNESMNCGCAVVASHAIGSAPFLINDNKNAYIYENGNFEELYKNVKNLLDNTLLQEEVGKTAYNTIKELWNAKVAATRLMELCNCIIKNGDTNLFLDGPCSKAEPICQKDMYNHIRRKQI